MIPNKVYWVSRHQLYDYQREAIREVHGKDVEIIEEDANFNTLSGLVDYINEHKDGYVYPVAGGIHLIWAVLRAKDFYIFGSNPLDRGEFDSIYHVFFDATSNSMRMVRVWARRN